MNSDSLLLAYGALAESSSSRVQQRIVLFLKRRLIQQMELNDTTNTIHLLHALGNTGSKHIIKLLFDYLAHSDSKEIQLAAIGAMRKLTGQESVQEAFVAILESNPQECFVEAIAKTLFTGQKHSHVHINENPRLLSALVVSSLMLSNNTELHHLVHYYLELVNTDESHRLGKLLEQPVSTRVRRDSTNDWDASNSVYNLVSPRSSRKKDVTSYPLHKAYLWERKLGTKRINMQLAAGAFGGISHGDFGDLNLKLFGKAVAQSNFFSRDRIIAEASAEVLYQNDKFRIELYFELLGNVLLDKNYKNFTSCCLRETVNLYNSQRRVFGFTYSVFIIVGTVEFFAELSAKLDVDLKGEVCISGANAAVYNPLHGSIALVFTVSGGPEGGASATFGVRNVSHIKMICV